ncbi:hypothetical protein AAC387_Pa10g1364 [Persea americana]
MAQGHVIPVVDMARLFAKHGVLTTIIPTPFNTTRIKTIVDQVIESGLPIQLVQLPFPSREAGLLDGCKNFDSIPSLDLLLSFLYCVRLVRKNSRTVIRRDSACPKLYNFRYHVPPMDNEDNPQAWDTKACVPWHMLLYSRFCTQLAPIQAF